MKHLTYGGSTATRTLNCPAWPSIAAKAPDIDRESVYAARGTMLHDCLEQMFDQDKSLDEVARGLDEDDREAVETAAAAAERVMDRYEIDDNGVITDAKFGHVPVTSTDQFLLYAIAALGDPKYTDWVGNRQIISAIVQPAVSEEAYITEHSESEIIDFHHRFMRAVKNETEQGNPGPWCKYCEGAPYCYAKRAEMGAFVKADPEQISELADAMALVQQAKDQIKNVEAEVFRLLENGERVPGWKLVMKRGIRKFYDDAAVLDLFRRSRKLKKEHYLQPPKLKSVAQLEKTLKREGIEYNLEPIISDAAPGTTLAPEDDKRPAVPGENEVPEALAKIL